MKQSLSERKSKHILLYYIIYFSDVTGSQVMM